VGQGLASLEPVRGVAPGAAGGGREGLSGRRGVCEAQLSRDVAMGNEAQSAGDGWGLCPGGGLGRVFCDWRRWSRMRRTTCGCVMKPTTRMVLSMTM
jgi:hypothetical protein